MGRASARIEKLGIPTTAIIRKGFTRVVGNAFAGMGFPAEHPCVHEFPVDMFLGEGTDLSPLKENIDKIIYGLTQWEPKVPTKVKVIKPNMITVHGKDYQGAVDKMNFLFLQENWGDGLPVVPPTQERVNWILTGTDRHRSTVVGAGGGKVLPRGGFATVEQVAVSLAMAGGRPEYLPVLIAAVEGILNPASTHFHWAATTNSTYPAVIVNGHIAKQLRINSGYGCLGPDPRHPAGASIGRAIRFILMDVGAAIPGVGTMAIYGGASRYTNLVFAEDEDGIPDSWEPHNVSYWDYPRNSNTLTVFPVTSSVNVSGTEVTNKESALVSLNQFSGFMKSPYMNYWQHPSMFEGAPGIVLMARGTARWIADLGWTKENVQQFLWENSHIPWDDMLKNLGAVVTKIGDMAMGRHVKVGQPWPITSKPENIIIVVAGGAQSGHGYWMQLAQSAPTSAEITLPKNWDSLLKQAEIDLGPIPSPAQFPL